MSVAGEGGDGEHPVAPAGSAENNPEPTARTWARRYEKDHLLELAQEAGGIGISEWNVASGEMWCSANWLLLYGIAGFDGRYDTWLETIFREDRVRVLDLIQTAFASAHSRLNVEFRIKRANDGIMRWMQGRYIVIYDDNRCPVRVVGVDADTTEQKRAVAQLRALTESLEERVKERTRELEAEYEARLKAEEALRQSQKMEAIGQLTGGVAHDFNNLLAVILGGLEAMGRQIPHLPEPSAVARITRSRELAVQGVERAATLTSRLLAFSRQQPLSPKGLDANKLVSGIGDLLRRTLGEHISLELVSAAGLWSTFVDANQLENALLNLAVNARDAMPTGGSLTIETGNASLDAEYVAGVAEPVTPGQYVLIAVTDTGCGMDQSTLAKVFEPFFTTKAVGKGTGLGLSQVYGFVRQSSGHIRIYSELGEGTTVKLYLPRHSGAAKSAVSHAQQIAPRAIGVECILVVEDDAALRSHATETLRELGYQVIEAAGGAAALEALRSQPGIDLLFTDVVMPGGMNGRQLAEEAHRLQPDLKVLFTTGYTRNAIVHHGRLDPGIDLISKPYSFHALASHIRARLDAAK